MKDFDINALKYDSNGLIPAIAQDAENKDVLMMAWMNKESLALSLQTGIMHYWSRSRQELWRKGATSGHEQTIATLKIDCDNDTLLALVHQKGAACHTGERSCFYTTVMKPDDDA
ncbi:MAG: phosphoribosyl-AMP cyclohydrolase [Alphaproteobacteria bacterium]|nr:phosphoribosyl-AMP cyclohydrolase [Alphaproteobacteria bacterium]